MMSNSATLNPRIASTEADNASATDLPTAWYADFDTTDGFIRAKPDHRELLAVYLLCEAGEERNALERAVALFEEPLRSGRFTEADALLDSTNVRRLGPTVLL